jgi:hypothetical protein
MDIDKFKDEHGHGIMVKVNPQEAAILIESLACQLAQESSNAGRAEMYTPSGEYLSVAVMFKSRG